LIEEFQTKTVYGERFRLISLSLPFWAGVLLLLIVPVLSTDTTMMGRVGCIYL